MLTDRVLFRVQEREQRGQWKLLERSLHSAVIPSVFTLALPQIQRPGSKPENQSQPQHVLHLCSPLWWGAVASLPLSSGGGECWPSVFCLQAHVAPVCPVPPADRGWEQMKMQVFAGAASPPLTNSALVAIPVSRRGRGGFSSPTALSPCSRIRSWCQTFWFHISVYLETLCSSGCEFEASCRWAVLRVDAEVDCEAPMSLKASHTTSFPGMLNAQRPCSWWGCVLMCFTERDGARRRGDQDHDIRHPV